MFCISGPARGTIWLPEDSVFSWHWEAHPSALQVFPACIPFPAAHLPSTLSWPRAHGEIWTVSPSAIKHSILPMEVSQQIKQSFPGTFWKMRTTSAQGHSASVKKKIASRNTKSHRWAKYESAFFLLQVLELLCQILQTDSLTTVQQWLLLAGQRGNVPPHVIDQRHVLPVSQWQGVRLWCCQTELATVDKRKSISVSFRLTFTKYFSFHYS